MVGTTPSFLYQVNTFPKPTAKSKTKIVCQIVMAKENQKRTRREPEENQKRTRREPEENQKRTRREPEENQKRTRRGPEEDQKRTRREPEENQKRTRTEPEGNQKRTRREPEENQKRTRREPEEDQKRTRREPEQNQNRTRREPAENQKRTRNDAWNASRLNTFHSDNHLQSVYGYLILLKTNTFIFSRVCKCAISTEYTGPAQRGRPWLLHFSTKQRNICYTETKFFENASRNAFS